jgi:hypothetical protein
MKTIKLVGYGNYGLAGCPVIFSKNVPVSVEDSLADFLLSIPHDNDPERPIFKLVSEDEVAEMPEKAPSEPEKAPPTNDLSLADLDTARSDPRAGKRTVVLGGTKASGKLAI